MPDAVFADPRLAALYDDFDGDRADLEAYLDAADRHSARSVLDVGCGTGVLALLLADRGLDVTGVDPARASLDVARAKPGADRVTWLEGDATTLPPLAVDLAVMTGNVAQAILGPAWPATLAGVHAALRPGGHLVLESRVPARRAWEDWTPDRTRTTVGGVTTWTDVLAVELPLVTFRHTFELADGSVLRSESTLQFRSLDELTAEVEAAGFTLVHVGDAPDRPGREHVLTCRAQQRAQ